MNTTILRVNCDKQHFYKTSHTITVNALPIVMYLVGMIKVGSRHLITIKKLTNNGVTNFK